MIKFKFQMRGYIRLEEALTTHFEITKLTKPLLINAASFFENEEFNEKLKIMNGFKVTLKVVT